MKRPVRARRRKTVLLGPLPQKRVVTGEAVAFGSLVDGLREEGVPFRTVDYATRTLSQGGLSLLRLFEYIPVMLRYTLLTAGGCKTVYILISRTLHGFARDCFAIWWASLWGHRIVCHLNAGGYDNFFHSLGPTMQKVVKATLAKTDRILVLGESLRKMFAFSPELEERIHVVPNGIPIGRDVPAPKTLPSGGEAVRVLYLSNMILTKGYRVVLEAAKILIREKGVSNLEVRFCGAFLTDHTEGGRLDADTARKHFDRFLQKENLAGHVSHHGVVTGREKERELAEAHFLLLPTAYETEGQPVCILEAMAAGCVVVATDYRAIPDMVVDGETGRLLSQADALEVAGAVKSVIDDPALFAAMSERAILRARSKFSVATYQSSLRRHILGEDTER